MQRDFTLVQYRRLLQKIRSQGYKVTSFENYQSNPNLSGRVALLRQDVDKLPTSALKIAYLQKDLGIQSSFYFRIKESVFRPDIVEQIANLGHEIGYHYEDLAMQNGDYVKAIISFEQNLNKIRKYYPVKTICMHGSPLSKWDNKWLWSKYDYREYGIIGEPYIDLDYSEILYLTDTGRRWNTQKYNVRDKVDSTFNFKFKNTNSIIYCLENDKLPDKLMLTIHPQRWHDNYYYWIYEFLTQNFKNMIKKNFFINKYKSRDLNAGSEETNSI